MSFLKGLGYFAGGVSKGIEAEASEHAKNVASDTADIANQQTRDDLARQNLARQLIQGSPALGDQVGMRGVQGVYDDRTAALATAPPPPTGLGAIAGRISEALGRRSTTATAQTAGILPAPTATALAAGASPAPAAPAPAPVPAASVAAATDSTPASPGLGVAPAPAAPTKDITRPWDEVDQAKYEMMAYHKAGLTDKANAAAQNFTKLANDRQLNMFDIASPEDKGNLLTSATGHQVQVLKQENGNYNLYVDGKLSHSDMTDGDLKGMAQGQLQHDPAVGWKTAMTYDAQKDKHMTAQAAFQQSVASTITARAKEATVPSEITKNMSQADKDRADAAKASADTSKVTQDVKIAGVQQNRMEFLGNHWNYVINPEAALEAATTGGYDKDGRYVRDITTLDPSTQTAIKTQQNAALVDRLETLNTWNRDNFVKANVVRRVDDGTGKFGLGIRDPTRPNDPTAFILDKTTGHPIIFQNLDSAKNFAVGNGYANGPPKTPLPVANPNAQPGQYGAPGGAATPPPRAAAAAAPPTAREQASAWDPGIRGGGAPGQSAAQVGLDLATNIAKNKVARAKAFVSNAENKANYAADGERIKTGKFTGEDNAQYAAARRKKYEDNLALARP